MRRGLLLYLVGGMTAAAAVSGVPAERGRLVSEGFSQHNVVVDRHSQHGCCQDSRATGAHRTLIGYSTDDPQAVATFALRCRSWRCPCCAVRLRARNRARALRGARLGRIVMLTLTLDPREVRYAASVREYVAAGGRGRAAPSVVHARESWNRLRTDLRRSFGPLPYFKGLELTKAGVAHLHVVVRVASLADFWRLRSVVGMGGQAERAGFGRIVQVDLARSSRDVARYVTKADGAASLAAAYVTKGVDGRFPKYARRGSWSRDWSEWTRATPIAGFRWTLAAAGLDRVRRALIDSDFVLVDPDAFRVRAAPAWGRTMGGFA